MPVGQPPSNIGIVEYLLNKVNSVRPTKTDNSSKKPTEPTIAFIEMTQQAEVGFLIAYEGNSVLCNRLTHSSDGWVASLEHETISCDAVRRNNFPITLLVDDSDQYST